MFRLVALVLLFWPAALMHAADAKVDGDLDDAETAYPVFVRMTDQLLPEAGAYEKFCAANQKRKRGELRAEVVKLLKKKSEDSYRLVEKTVNKLKEDKQLKDVTRFWIVNGFACAATGKACRKLAESPAVSFVYRQRGPVKQHVQVEPQPVGAAMMKLYADLAKDWKDDSDKPVVVDGFEIPWNVKRIQADQVWAKEKAAGKGVTVALMDSGLIVTPALTAALWKNPREQLNGKDDDGNGYVDDLFGYDFRAGSFQSLGDSRQVPHGSMCGGIIAGRPLNQKKLITGIAPRARLMVLRGMGYLKAYEYALENGADIISMSYMWVNIPLGNFRGVFRTAHEHLAAAGVISVGGAGNFANLPKGKQIALPKDIPCVIAAAGVLEDGSKAPASSQGPCFWDIKFYNDYPQDKPLAKPDVTGCFGGYPVWGRPTRFRNWKVYSKEGDNAALIIGPQGNSFSGPHAAGVAALMLSANPDLNAWEVKALMESTCKDIGEKGRDPVFGAGLLQALDAVRAARKVKK